MKAGEKSKGFVYISAISACVGLKRHVYYKYKRREDKRLEVEKKVVAIVKNRRRSLPREGVRKLTKSLKQEFDNAQKIGRDTFFNILRKHNILKIREKYSSRTTNTLHELYKYKNIIKDVEVTRPNQVWVSDITYIRTIKGLCYLGLITNMYSRKIVGYDISNSLEPKGCARALNKA